MMLLLESQAALHFEVLPRLARSSPQVQQRFKEYVLAAKEKAEKNQGATEQYAAFLADLLKSLPALYNHVELNKTISQNPTQRFEINDWFDHEIMPVPLAYASVFVAQDKGIRDLVKNRTKILKRQSLRVLLQLGRA